MKRMMWIGVLAAVSLSAAAEDAVSPQVPQTGEKTRQWLDLQVSGNASLGAVRPMPGDVAEKVYERYLNSFDHPLPEQMQREQFVSEGGGS